ncbi:MAG TPA: hypothetical protein VG826_04355 [Pirellulales bacterium]|nr:hypothetical protein [Pirellulales bacterium]
MKRLLTSGMVIVATAVVLTAGTVAAQKGRNKPANGNKVTTTSQGSDAAKSEPELAADPRLKKLQVDFVIEAARLAKEYERKRDIEGARGCYEQILRLVPHHPEAEKALERIHGEELTAEKKKLQVKATDGWQDTGVNVIANRPIQIRADGTWTFRMEYVLDADGMEIPEELKDFNLGCLVGKIVTGGNADENKPFQVGKEQTFTPEAAGRLFLRMYDHDPSDNKGYLSVEITGTFEKGK